MTTLYKDKQFWKIYVKNNIIVREYGQINGKRIMNTKQVYGKNKGKSNETTDYAQALKECDSLIRKQREKGYQEHSEHKEPNDEILQRMVIKPMLANEYGKFKHKVQYPCYVQPKIDGIRLIVNNGKMYSRTGKEMKNIQIDGLDPNLIYDGEMYNPDLSFEIICSCFKTNPSILNYHIFDIIDCSKTFENRQKLLKDSNKSYDYIVETHLCQSEQDIIKYHDQFVETGYEGIMIRNLNSMYQKDKRSFDLLKWKYFCTKEFKIVDIVEAENDKDTAMFVFENFTARPRGTFEYRKKLLIDKNKLIGKEATIQYQNMTSNNVPRFPVVLVVRDYE